MQLPETTIANQSLLKTGFRNASQVEVFSEVFPMGEVVDFNLFRLVQWVLSLRGFFVHLKQLRSYPCTLRQGLETIKGQSRPQHCLHRLVGKFVVRTLSSVDVWSSLSPCTTLARNLVFPRGFAPVSLLPIISFHTISLSPCRAHWLRLCRAV